MKEEVPKKSFILQRIDKTEHLKTFQKFINFCDNIRQNFR
ncbi:hypothetical protein MICAF_5250012 [Microcystis aeruginosa PCC 9807]|uniref:Uncharacterized protein n=2 Tax=Microcystis TaxID=1125 RepID=I4HC21_MICAE|nr:hypothetical protein VL20_2842 [Microcystis panniformis FACHB-1757]CCI19595.1 hypothetical protein MICAF_5250012 [Microcystis aeruginosa PCC 9807]